MKATLLFIELDSGHVLPVASSFMSTSNAATSSKDPAVPNTLYSGGKKVICCSAADDVIVPLCPRFHLFGFAVTKSPYSCLACLFLILCIFYARFFLLSI